MFKFIKESLKEFDHVQWPTPAETKSYFKIVTIFIIVFAISLYIAGSLLSSGLFFARETLNIKTPAAITDTGTISDIDVNNLEIQTGALDKTNTASGASASGVVETAPKTGTGN